VNLLPVIKVRRKMVATNAKAISVIMMSRLVTMSRFLHRVEGVSTDSGSLAKFAFIPIMFSSDWKVTNGEGWNEARVQGFEDQP